MANVSVVDVGKLTKPATILIEKISSAIGIIYEPRRIKNIAVAEAEALKTKALIDLEIEDIQKRALNRLVTEEIKKQENIESITEKSFDSINEQAKPNEIEDDWISNFFDKCKLISDDEMQTLWAQILAGEANTPGTFSKRTVEFMSTMDKNDAILFNDLCKFTWFFDGYQPLIIDYNDNDIFQSLNITFDSLRHLNDIGLISFENIGYLKQFNINKIDIAYFGRILNLNVEKMTKKEVKTGVISFTKIGIDIATVTHPSILSKLDITYGDEYIDKYYHYIVEKFYKQGIVLSEPLSNKIS